jgi:hypothetical protein
MPPFSARAASMETMTLTSGCGNVVLMRRIAGHAGHLVDQFVLEEPHLLAVEDA